MATHSILRPLTAAEFEQIDFGSGLKAELDNGVIRMMAGGSRRHDRVQFNLLLGTGNRLRGSGCRPSGSDMGIRTHAGSVRYPDLSIFCGGDGSEDDAKTMLDDPRVIVEVLSPGTEASDRGVKLAEYKALASVDTIALVDPESERLHVVQRVSHAPEAWVETRYLAPVDLDLPTLGIIVPHAEIFARD